MPEYNTSQSPIKLPEYGRNIEKLVKYCKTIPDKELRTRYAYQIIKIMADVNPDINDIENKEQILWDQLAMIADFELDIDYPCEIITAGQINATPEMIPYKTDQISLRLYGSITEKLLAKATEMPDAEQRIKLFELCANQMKLTYLKANKDAEEDDNKIIQDILKLIGDQFRDEVYQVFLYSGKELLDNEQYDENTLTPTTKKKKKKKKKK